MFVCWLRLWSACALLCSRVATANNAKNQLCTWTNVWSNQPFFVDRLWKMSRELSWRWKFWPAKQWLKLLRRFVCRASLAVAAVATTAATRARNQRSSKRRNVCRFCIEFRIWIGKARLRNHSLPLWGAPSLWAISRLKCASNRRWKEPRHQNCLQKACRKLNSIRLFVANSLSNFLIFGLFALKIVTLCWAWTRYVKWARLFDTQVIC